MAILMTFLGIGSMIAFLFFFTLTKKQWILPVLLLFSISMFIIPNIGNKKPISIKHHSFISNKFENKVYSSPVRIEYDIYTYPWWTYRWTVDFVKPNLVITFPDGTKQTDER